MLAVVRRLQAWFRGRLALAPVFWESEPLAATAGFQQEIDRRVPPAKSDIALFVLWSRLGTKLSAEFTLPDGTRPTGTEWEFHDAHQANQERGAPHILVYRKSERVAVSLDQDEGSIAEVRSQYASVQHFFETRFRNADDLSFTGSFHAFQSAAEFGQVLETHLTKLLTERLEGSTATWHESPFRGLQAFEFEHAPIFFGRSRAIHEVRHALRAQVQADRAFVLILGTSGSGKSSLVRAGLLPLLQVPGVIEESVVGGTCRRATMSPSDGSTPLESLAAALLGNDAVPHLADHGSAADLATAFAESPQAGVALVRGSLARVEPSPARLVLVVDQFEELFSDGDEGQAARNPLINALDALARSSLVYVLATLRSDFYPSFAAEPKLMALKDGDGQYDLTPPDAAELAQIIRRPAQVAGLTYETDNRTGRTLDGILLTDATASPDALPLLEYALSEIYDRRDVRIGMLTFEAYEALGGVEGALAARASEEWAALSSDAQDALPFVVRALVDVGDRTATKRRASWTEATRARGASEFVERFVAARLLVADTDAHGEPVVSVIHEALLRRWEQMTRQIRIEGRLLRARTRMRRAARAWAERGRDQNDLDTGRKLAEDRELTEHGFDLTEEERAFIAASNARARRAHTLRRVAMATITLLAIAASLLAWTARRAQNKATREASTAARERDEKADALKDKAQALDEVAKERDAKSVALAQVLRLADAKKIRDLIREADTLWPVHPNRAPAMASWLDRSQAVLENRTGHEETQARLRKHAQPYTEEQRATDRAEQIRRLTLLQGRLAETGVVVRELRPQGQAALAGIRPGDLVTAYGAHAITDFASFGKAFQAVAALGKPVMLRFTRAEEPRSARVNAGALGLRIADARMIQTGLDQARTAPVPRLTWSFATPAEEWQHQVLCDVITDLDLLATTRHAITRRHESAATQAARSLDAKRREWQETIRGIAASRKYGGLTIKPQLGLVPLGPDPDSGLFEFVHLGSGSMPTRDKDTGRLVLADDFAVVLVLIPGGSFRMGGPPDSLPVHDVTLTPYFLAKYECSQAQWERLSGTRPSRVGKESMRCPVEQVSWDDCILWISRYQLVLPSEAQWEYACRAGTNTPWFTGSDVKSLGRAGNIADTSMKRQGPASWLYTEEVKDGYSTPAPVGSLAPNAFGLHDVHGNVTELCLDTIGPYPSKPVTDPIVRGDGLRIYRGGSWDLNAAAARSSFRDGRYPNRRLYNLGLRPARALALD